MSKKTIMYVIVAIVAIAVITTGAILVLNYISNKTVTKITPTVKTATDLRNKAEEARKNNDKAQSTTLLLEAQQQIKELPKTDANTAAGVDVEAQLYLLEHAGTTK